MKLKAGVVIFLLLLPAVAADLSLSPQHVRVIVGSQQKFTALASLDIMGTYTIRAEGAEVWNNNTRTFIGSGKREIPFFYTPEEEGRQTIILRLYDQDEVLIATAQASLDAYIPYNSSSLHLRIESILHQTQALYDSVPQSRQDVRDQVYEINTTLSEALALTEAGEYSKATQLADSAEYRLENVYFEDRGFEFPRLGLIFILLILALAVSSTVRFFFSKE